MSGLMQLSLRREHRAPRLSVDFILFFRRGGESDAEDGIFIAQATLLGQRIAYSSPSMLWSAVFSSRNSPIVYEMRS